MSRYQPPSSSRRRPLEDPPLPQGFTSIRDVLDDSLHHSRTVSVIGLVKDYMLPRSTARADWKSKITLYDQTTQESSPGINLDIFLPEDEMPKVGAGDVVIASRVTRQRWQGTPSLLTKKNLTDVHVYDACNIAKCRGTRSARGALKPPSAGKVHRQPDQKEHEYALWLYNNIYKGSVVDREEVATRAEKTLEIKNKFSLLQDVEIANFADLVAQVVKTPYDQGDMVTLWVSDYTENSGFFHKSKTDSGWVDGEPIRDGDPYGYTSKWSSKPKNSMTAEDKWLGPYGKMSIQLTCWEPHAEYIRSNVGPGDWVHLRNVQIGHGKFNVEGFLRTDRAYPDRVYVQVLDTQADIETLDPRLVEALRRKRDYGKDQKQMLKGGTKRKAEGSVQSENSKSRRRTMREEKEKARVHREQETKREQEALLDLNDHIRCDNSNKQSVPFSSILEPVRYDTTFDLPFTCAKYRTQARVVDFHPARLEDFATFRTVDEFRSLDDNHSESSASSEGDEWHAPPGRVAWEWRFALKLEEPKATLPKGKKPASAWVLVDNGEAQLLTDLDAKDLRSKDNADLLERLRQRMFILWGDLEERKSAVQSRNENNAWMRPPPLDEDAEDNGGGNGHVSSLSQTSNKPFACCIRQYGVKVTVKDGEEGEEANAGDQKRWQRVFGLFGTKIAID